MSDERFVPPSDDDQPEPEEKLNPVLSEEGAGDPVTDDQMEEPTDLPNTSFEADPDDTRGRHDRPADSPPQEAPDTSPPDFPQEVGGL